jgi:predicted kinase
MTYDLRLLIMVGISGSGKSTWARQFVLDNPRYLRLGRDELRRSILPVPLGEFWQWDDVRKNRIERLVSDLEKAALLAALDKGWNVVLDNTHLRQKYINDVLKSVANYTLTVDFQVIETPLDEAIRRDRARPDVVGEAVIREQMNRFQVLKKQVDLTRTFTFPLPLERAEPMTQRPDLPRCILVDIDGTVALMRNRSPFDWARVGEDRPNAPVLAVVRAMRAAGCAVIFLSGRDAVCRAETVGWLAQHLDWQVDVDYKLFMRPANDNRKDAIIKRELFDAHIRDQYAVEFVLDDRDQVVALWRNDLGLTCLQVDYGNF